MGQSPQAGRGPTSSAWRAPRPWGRSRTPSFSQHSTAKARRPVEIAPNRSSGQASANAILKSAAATVRLEQTCCACQAALDHQPSSSKTCSLQYSRSRSVVRRLLARSPALPKAIDGQGEALLQHAREPGYGEIASQFEDSVACAYKSTERMPAKSGGHRAAQLRQPD